MEHYKSDVDKKELDKETFSKEWDEFLRFEKLFHERCYLRNIFPQIWRERPDLICKYLWNKTMALVTLCQYINDFDTKPQRVFVNGEVDLWLDIRDCFNKNSNLCDLKRGEALLLQGSIIFQERLRTPLGDGDSNYRKHICMGMIDEMDMLHIYEKRLEEIQNKVDCIIRRSETLTKDDLYLRFAREIITEERHAADRRRRNGANSCSLICCR